MQFQALDREATNKQSSVSPPRLASSPVHSSAPTRSRPREMAKSDPVVIVAAGAFGLSAALHLTRAGYTDVTVLDKAEAVPPPRYSAANDLNKFVMAEYEDGFYRDLALETPETRRSQR
ncbi:FAD dependent oxidoreductase [Metarhizium album ARSEF 1941]|uniref:FAD dependent oxidoreductase n=1 Tax=Metarhizium album (strain ARSEF 1941) TaxID=1081103 RepID=A0A0B2WGY8_METAS|nr:FAD dependent oxidoreductase [Metarhizium album ARSEF 1941]KHN95241.1 FAD dependent oxidoreductase [Metarhizium album ARSEF 1941]